MDQKDLTVNQPQGELITITVSEAKERAFITLMAQRDGRNFTEQEINDELTKAGIVHGIHEDAIKQLARGNMYRQQVLVATSTEAEDGHDARFHYLFPLSSDAKPKELPNGSVDFKNLGLIKNVEIGDQLCEKIPLTPGIPGTDVTGGEIPAKPGKDYPLPLGQNTAESEDGLYVISKVNGQVDLINNRVCVMNVFMIEENVDYNTGNIDFVGNVVIKGDVIAGFTVSAAGNVHIKGCLDGGIVDAGGNVTIENGVNGQANGKIKCGGDLKCKYLQNANVDVGMNLETTSCVNSVVHVGGTAKFMGNQAMLLSSRVTAGQSVETLNIGSRSSSAGSVIEVGVNPHVSQRFKQIPHEISNIHKNLEKLERIIALYTQLQAANRLDDAKKAELIKLTATVKNAHDD
jgi:uncharacterized protein (DUF342 family)